MWQSVDDWIAETDSDARQGKYYKKDKDGQPTGSLVDLSTTDSPDGSPADFCFLLSRSSGITMITYRWLDKPHFMRAKRNQLGRRCR